LVGDNLEPTRYVYKQYILHLVTSPTLGLPAWFRDGLSNVYSTFAIQGGEAHVGLPVESHIGALRNGHWGALATPNDEAIAEVVASGYDPLFPARSWAMVHYLLFGKEDRSREARAFLEAVRTCSARTASRGRNDVPPDSGAL